MAAQPINPSVTNSLVWTWSLAFTAAHVSLIWGTSIVAFHHDVRGSIFTGFLTLGSFLLTTKTFVVTRLQDGLFQTKEYDRIYQVGKQQRGDAVGERNQPLRNLSEFLVWSVVSCLSASVLQLILSTIEHELCSAAAMGVCAGALSLVLRSWWHIRSLIQTYLEAANKAPLK